MDNATFEKLPDQKKLAYMLGIASQMFGRERVQQLYQDLNPIVQDLMGHGSTHDELDPHENDWEGVWQVYHAK